jgi:hypothetical protein
MTLTTARYLVRRFFFGKGITPGKATHWPRIVFNENNLVAYSAGDLAAA